MSALDDVINYSRNDIYRPTKEFEDNARAELAQLRASVTELKARCDELTEMAIGRDAEIERLHNAIEALTAERDEQARRLEEWRWVLISITPYLPNSGDCYNVIHPARKLAEDWISATAPAPNEERIDHEL